MATVKFYQAYNMVNPTIFYGTTTVATSSQVTINDFRGTSGSYFGYGITYSGSTVTGGTVTAYDSYRNYSIATTVRDVSVDARTLASLVNSGNPARLESFVLSGNDAITGSEFSDAILGYSGDDHINGLGGNDYIDGGDGTDTVYFFNSLSSHIVRFESGRVIITGSQGQDTLVAVEYFNFAGRNYSLSELQNFDGVAPQISSFSPADGAIGVKVNSNITFSFNEPITKGVGIIYIRTGSATGPIVEQLNIASSSTVSVNGNNLVIDPTNLLESTTYFVTMGSGAVKDLSGNSYAGIGTYDFRTVTSSYDHVFTNYQNYKYGDRYETTDIKIPGYVILGTLGNDDLYGTEGVDYVAGYQGLDLIMTYGGNDVIYPSVVRSNGDAGDGIDTLVFTRPFSNSTIEPYLFRNANAVLDKGVTVKRNGDTYSFTSFNNVERLQFTDTNLALDVGPTQNAGSVYMIYKAAFNRAPDASGMGYWLAQKDGGSDMVTNIAQGFVNSAEFIAKYGANPSNSSYVNNLYKNVLGRAGEAGGVTYWTGEMDAGRVSKAQALVQFATLSEGASLVAPLIANGIQYQEWTG